MGIYLYIHTDITCCLLLFVAYSVSLITVSLSMFCFPSVPISLPTSTHTSCFQSLTSIIRAGRIPFLYLEDIQMRFMKNYGRVAHSALAYAMNDEFSRVLHHQMEFFSSNPSADTLNRLRGEVSEATTFKLKTYLTYSIFQSYLVYIISSALSGTCRYTLSW